MRRHCSTDYCACCIDLRYFSGANDNSLCDRRGLQTKIKLHVLSGNGRELSLVLSSEICERCSDTIDARLELNQSVATVIICDHRALDFCLCENRGNGRPENDCAILIGNPAADGDVVEVLGNCDARGKGSYQQKQERSD